MPTDKVDTLQQWQTYIKTPSPVTLEPVLDNLQHTIDSAITTYAGGQPTYKTRATILATEAIKSYDPQKGAGLPTHVFNHLRRLNRISSERRQAVHTPEGVRLDGLHVTDFINRFKDENNREPSDIEIADKLQMSSKRVRKALGWAEIPASKLQTEKGDDTVIGTSESQDRIWADYVYHDLDDISKTIMAHTVGYQGAPILPKKDIAAKVGISPAAVSQRINTISNKLSALYD